MVNGTKRGKQGFTLMEMLLAVAILAVTAAIVIPSVVHIRNALLFRQRNDHARTIFLTAQRQLIRMRAEGNLDHLQAELPAAVPQIGDGQDTPPEGYGFLGSMDTGFDLLLPAGSVEDAVREQQIIIEFNPGTAEVFSVFYAEEGNLQQQYTSGSLCRASDRRREQLLGYYSGEGLSDAELGIHRVAAEMAFLDGQEGLVSIRVPTQTKEMENLFDSGNYQRYVNGLGIRLTISGERGGRLHRTIKVPGQMIPYTSQPGNGGVNMLCFIVLLDSLTGGSFAGNGEILPGDNISLAAEISFLSAAEDPLILIDPAVTAGINPMFASLTDGDNGGYVLTVSNGRHLQNLNALSPEIAKKVRTVLFSVGAPGKSDTQVIDWQQTMDYYGGSLKFTPIENPYLFGGGTLENDSFLETHHRSKNAEIVGCGTRIENLVIDSNSAFVGLFGSLNTNVDGLCLVNPRILGGENALAVGGLAGAAGEDSRITDCGLIAEGEAECFVSGSGAVGGLVGLLESSRENTVTVRSCCNTVPVLAAGNARAGGLLGVNRGAYIRDCHVLGKVQGAAGFAADNSGIIRESTANVTMETGAAFVKENTGTVRTSYGWVTGNAELTVNGNCRGCYFARLEASGDAVLYDDAGQQREVDNIDALASSDALQLLGDGWNPAGSQDAHPIDETLTKYPYPMLGDHYGDWAVPGRAFACGVLYYERYADGSAGVTLENLSQHPSGEIQPIRDGVVLEAGYALYCRTGSQPFDEETESLKGEPLEGLHIAAGLSGLYSIYALDCDENLVTVAIRDGYDSATLIPLFADTINRIQSPYRIRCQAQLENIPRWGQGEFLLEGKIPLDDRFAGLGDFDGILTGAEGSVIDAQGMCDGLVDTLTGRLQNIVIEGQTGHLLSGLLAETVLGGTISNCHISARVYTSTAAVVGRMESGEIKNCTLSGTVSGDTSGSFVNTAEGGRFQNCHVTVDCSLPFAGAVTVTGEKTLENATHYALSYFPDGRYARQSAAQNFVPLTAAIPVYDAVFENCSFLQGGEKLPVTELRYYYQLTSVPGYQTGESPDSGRYALVTEDGKLLGVNENGQITADRDFSRMPLSEMDIWVADGETYRNLHAEGTVLSVTQNPADSGTVQVSYAETITVTVTEFAPDGTAVKVTGEQTELRTLQCELYHVAETTDSIAVYLGKSSVVSEVEGQ